MAQDLVSIYNLALSAIGTRARISSPDEDSREAQICRLWYPLVRDTVLRAAHWASCRNIAALTVDAEATEGEDWAEGDPEPPWIYRYNLPSDFLYPRYLDMYQQFEITSHNNQTMLLTNASTAILIYTKRQDIPSAWDPDLYNAVVYGLAGAITMPLNGKPDRARNAYAEANDAIIRARVAQANLNHVVQESVPDWLVARGVGQQLPYSQYIYNYGPLFSSVTL